MAQGEQQLGTRPADLLQHQAAKPGGVVAVTAALLAAAARRPAGTALVFQAPRNPGARLVNLGRPLARGLEGTRDPGKGKGFSRLDVVLSALAVLLAVSSLACGVVGVVLWQRNGALDVAAANQLPAVGRDVLDVCAMASVRA